MSITAERAISLLNVAKATDPPMYTSPLPESDGDKITEAEKLINMAKQAYEMASAAQKHIPPDGAIMKILREANADVKIGEPFVSEETPPQGEDDDEPEVDASEPKPAFEGAIPITVAGADTTWPWGEIINHVIVNRNTNLTIHDPHWAAKLELIKVEEPPPQQPSAADAARAHLRETAGLEPDEQMTDDQLRERLVELENQPATDSSLQEQQVLEDVLQHGHSAPVEDVAPAEPEDDGLPKAGDTWLDSSGTVWVVDNRYAGHVEAHMDGSEEKTMLPTGFLKTRRDTAANQVKEEPSSPTSSSPEQPSPPSSGSTEAPAEPVERVVTISPTPSSSEKESSPEEPSSPPSSSSEPTSGTVTFQGPGGEHSVAHDVPSDQMAAAMEAAITPPSPAGSEEPPVEKPSEPAGREIDPSRSDAPPLDDDEGDEEYAKLLAEVDATFESAGLPLPVDINKPPDGALLEDLTAIGEEEQRKLHSQYNACAARVRYLLGLERGKRIACNRKVNQYLKPAIRRARAQMGKDATLTEVTNEAEEEEIVATWIRRRNFHADNEDAYKDLFAIYTENVSVLSRDWTMRDQEQRGS